MSPLRGDPTYDRIGSTVAVRPIPASWLAFVPRGSVCTPCDGRSRLDVRAARFGANIDKRGIFVHTLWVS